MKKSLWHRMLVANNNMRWQKFLARKEGYVLKSRMYLDGRVWRSQIYLEKAVDQDER